LWLGRFSTNDSSSGDGPILSPSSLLSTSADSRLARCSSCRRWVIDTYKRQPRSDGGGGGLPALTPTARWRIRFPASSLRSERRLQPPGAVPLGCEGLDGVRVPHLELDQRREHGEDTEGEAEATSGMSMRRAMGTSDRARKDDSTSMRDEMR
jgi:hypothetical protein